MPDRDFENRDELLDRGWQKMSGILDVEMPQHKSRRRLFFWIPLGLIVVLAMSFSIWNWTGGDTADRNEVQQLMEQTSPDEERSGEESQDAPVESRVKSSGEVLASAKQEERPASNDNSGKKVTGNQSINENKSDGFRKVESTERASVIAQAQTGDLSESGGISTVEEAKKIEALAAVEDDIEALGGDQAVDEPALEFTPSTRDNRDVAMVHSLKPLATPLAADRAESRVGEVIPVMSKFKGSFGLDAYVSTHWNSPVQLQGVEGGILASWNASPRFTITGGAAYGHHRKLGIADLVPNKRDDSELAQGQDPDTTGFGNIAYDLNRVGYDTAEVLVNKLNYLHLPLYVEYRAAHNLSVRVGARASYMLAAPVSEQGMTFAVNTPFPGSQLLDADSSPKLLLKEGLVRRWDFAPMIGIGWDISRILALDVNYQHGLKPYIDRDAVERSDYNRTLSVGLRIKML